MKSAWRVLLAIALLVSLAGCSSAASGPVEPAVDEQRTSELVSALDNTYFAGQISDAVVFENEDVAMYVAQPREAAWAIGEMAAQTAFWNVAGISKVTIFDSQSEPVAVFERSGPDHVVDVMR